MELLKDGITLVDFWAPWCGPCKTQTPILHEIETELRNTKFSLVKINVEDEMETAALWNIRAIPTLLIFKNGSIALRLSGLQTKSAIMQHIQHYQK